jgi:hypothetical protein
MGVHLGSLILAGHVARRPTETSGDLWWVTERSGDRRAVSGDRHGLP